MIFKPRVVRAEWASIEAMGGTEAEEEGGLLPWLAILSLGVKGVGEVCPVLHPQELLQSASASFSFAALQSAAALLRRSRRQEEGHGSGFGDVG